MELGWLDVCLRVREFGRSREFYERLGFRMVERIPEDGWGVFVRESARIGLYSELYMGSDGHSLNFRGGNVSEVYEQLGLLGVDIQESKVRPGERSGSIKLRDPDGNLIFIDSAPGEVRLD